MAETSSYLPPELIETILSSELLSVKDLLRFKSVSKSWYSIISDPLFIKSHHQRSKSRNPQDLFICDIRDTSSAFSLVKLEDQKLEVVQELERPYGFRYIICRCGGVLLLAGNSRTHHVLWNPSTRTQKQITIPPQPSKSRYGLCPDPTTDDNFKVVMVNNDDYSVYSVKNKSLETKKLDGLYSEYGRVCHHDAVCVDGAVYWVSNRGNVESIIYYDPRDDRLKFLEKPEYVKDGKGVLLVDLGGSPCLRCEGEDETTIKIWIKEKGIDNNSWKDLITVENVRIAFWMFEPQCLLGNKIVIQEKFYRHPNFVVYSPLQKTFEQLGEIEFSWCYHHGLIPYVDSPVITTITRRKGKRKRVSAAGHVRGGLFI